MRCSQAEHRLQTNRNTSLSHALLGLLHGELFLAHRHLDGDLGVAPDGHDDARLAYAAEAGLLRAELVRARRELDEQEVAVGVRLALLRSTDELRRGQGDERAGDGETWMPASSIAAILSSAPPLPPEMIAPA